MHANGPAATYLFLTFCRLAGIDSCKQVHLLKKTLEIWSKRTSVIEASSVIRRMQEEIRKARETEQHRKE